MKADFIIGMVQTPAGKVPKVSTTLTWRDYLGAVRVRWGYSRESYKVEPGLYAVGEPQSQSDVLVTANYKLSFDTVRKNVNGLNVWLLVLDTKGVNVWCAAGKGTFGTHELVYRITQTNLEKIVVHRRLIVPQLGATGISAHEVNKATGSTPNQTLANAGALNLQNFSNLAFGLKTQRGFNVKYGPVRASDIKDFIARGYKASPAMRKVQFNLWDRAKLIPNDFMYGLKYFGWAFAILLLVNVAGMWGQALQLLVYKGQQTLVNLFAGYVSGIILTPLLLPYIPIRMFALKGIVVSILATTVLMLLHNTGNSAYETGAWYLLNAAVASFVAMNFTGSSTYTSLSGVKKEMKLAIPLQITFAAIGLVLFAFVTILKKATL